MKSFVENMKEYESPRILLLINSEEDIITTSGNGDDDNSGNDYMGEWDPF